MTGGKVITWFTFILVTIGCADSLNTCPANSPEEIGWLNDEIIVGSSNVYSDTYVYKTNYQFITIFIISTCCPSCNTLPPQVRDCEGKLLGYIGVDFKESVLDNAKLFWRTHNGACQ